MDAQGVPGFTDQERNRLDTTRTHFKTSRDAPVTGLEMIVRQTMARAIIFGVQPRNTYHVLPRVFLINSVLGKRGFTEKTTDY